VSALIVLFLPLNGRPMWTPVTLRFRLHGQQRMTQGRCNRHVFTVGHLPPLLSDSLRYRTLPSDFTLRWPPLPSGWQFPLPGLRRTCTSWLVRPAGRTFEKKRIRTATAVFCLGNPGKLGSATATTVLAAQHPLLTLGRAGRERQAHYCRGGARIHQLLYGVSAVSVGKQVGSHRHYLRKHYTDIRMVHGT
jgi:hypothetical protein